LRAAPAKRGRSARPPTVSARLSGHVTLEHTDGNIIARFDGYAVGLGPFSAGAADRAQELGTGLPLASFVSGGRAIDKETDRLARRLARHGLLEYRLARPGNEDQIVIEPQVADYWPQTPPLDNADVLVLSRFAYMRRRGSEMVLESPRAGALFRICDPKVAAALALLCTPQQIKRFRRQDGFPGIELLALLAHCGIVFKVDADDERDLRSAEGDSDLVLWDFHDLLFHGRSTEGRHANPLGGVFAHVGARPQPPAVRRRWPGQKIELRNLSLAPAGTISPAVQLLHSRHSVRSFDDERAITLAELSRFLDGTARVSSTWKSRIDLGDTRPVVAYAARPYPSAGASYELELYLTVHKCEGLDRGFYHYDAGGHALVLIGARMPEIEAVVTGAQFAMDAPVAPHIVITIAARFGRVSWKYSSLAYALILKDVGVLLQTFYLMATDMGLGGCAIGSTNIDLFAKMTGIEFHVEGPVGQFALGRGTKLSTPVDYSDDRRQSDR
jgi:SagB-type dehydrogenase family enzyme